MKYKHFPSELFAFFHVSRVFVFDKNNYCWKANHSTSIGITFLTVINYFPLRLAKYERTVNVSHKTVDYK